MKSVKILIVEDEPIIAEDLSMILKKEGYQIAGIANDGTSALDLLFSQTPDLALLDISLDSTISGLDIAQVINEKYEIPFIFITSFSDRYTLDRAKEVFPHGYIVKPFKKRDILANIEIALHRTQNQVKSHYLALEELNLTIETPISPKEYELMLHIVEGKTNSDLVEIHFISMNTVKTHLKRIFRKLDIDNRAQVAQYLLR